RGNRRGDGHHRRELEVFVQGRQVERHVTPGGQEQTGVRGEQRQPVGEHCTREPPGRPPRREERQEQRELAEPDPDAPVLFTRAITGMLMMATYRPRSARSPKLMMRSASSCPRKNQTTLTACAEAAKDPKPEGSQKRKASRENGRRPRPNRNTRPTAAAMNASPRYRPQITVRYRLASRPGNAR